MQTVCQSELFPTMDNAAPARLHWLVVRRVPTAATLWDAIMPALYDADKLNEAALLRAWKYAAAAHYMMQRSIRPRSCRWGQRHMLAQCGGADRLAKIEDEVRRRGLLSRYGVEISLLSQRE